MLPRCPPWYERPLVMRTSRPSASSSLATRSTFSSLALVKTFLIACSPIRRHVRGRLAGGDADQSHLRRAGDQLAFAVVDQPERQPARTLRAGDLGGVQQPSSDERGVGKGGVSTVACRRSQ